MTNGSSSIKLSSPATEEFWQIPVIYEDEHLMALAKPSCLLTSPDQYDPARPNLMRMVHAAVEKQTPWAAERRLNYLANAHRLDFETTGVLLLAKDRETLVKLANLFSSSKISKTYIALVGGVPAEDEFTVDASLAPDLRRPEIMRCTKTGKQSLTRFKTVEKFTCASLLECSPVTGRTHQIRVHLQHAGFPIYGDELYGAGRLFLSQIKRDYRLKPGREERPMTPTLALHSWKMELAHPATGATIHIESPWPKDLLVALKYLRQYATLRAAA